MRSFSCILLVVFLIVLVVLFLILNRCRYSKNNFLPGKLTIADQDSGYDYAVVRDHDGELARIDSKINDGILSFSTDKFSTYTIVKAEKTVTGAEAAKPDKQMLEKTGDSNVAVFAVFLTFVAAVSSLVACRHARLQKAC